MKRLWVYLSLLLLTVLPMAAAQSGMPALDPKAWGAEWAQLSAVVLFATASLKRAADARGVLKNRRYVWYSISLALGMLGALGLNALGYGASFGTLAWPLPVLVFGALAGVSAAGFRDQAKTAAGWVPVRTPAAPATVGDILPPAGVISPNPATVIAPNPDVSGLEAAK